jgi:hypothetical protein
MAGIGVPFLKGFDPRRKTATGEKIASSVQKRDPDKSDATAVVWEPEEDSRTRELRKQLHNDDYAEPAEPEEPIEHADLVARFYRLPPYVNVDDEGRIIRKEPRPEKGEGFAFLYLHFL